MATPVNSFPSLSPCGWEEREYPEAASMSFKRGAPLKLTSGKLDVLQAAGGNWQASDGEFVGFALQDATGVTDTMLKVIAPKDQSHYIDIHSDTTTAVTHVGVECEITVSATEGLLADVGTTSSPVLEILDIRPDYPLGESKGTYRARLLSSVYIGG